jgi:hypothetical protein
VVNSILSCGATRRAGRTHVSAERVLTRLCRGRAPRVLGCHVRKSQRRSTGGRAFVLFTRLERRCSLERLPSDGRLFHSAVQKARSIVRRGDARRCCAAAVLSDVRPVADCSTGRAERRGQSSIRSPRARSEPIAPDPSCAKQHYYKQRCRRHRHRPRAARQRWLCCRHQRHFPVVWRLAFQGSRLSLSLKRPQKLSFLPTPCWTPLNGLRPSRSLGAGS